LESILRSRDSFITELQERVETYKKELNGAETKLQQELSRSQILEQELQVQKNKVSEVLEECQQKTDDFIRCQDECIEVCTPVQTPLCIMMFYYIY
jgi:chromosome segregation ATPase